MSEEIRPAVQFPGALGAVSGLGAIRADQAAPPVDTSATGQRANREGATMKRPGYREAVAWIALNDEAACVDLEEVQFQISVLLIADIFGISEERVGIDVIRYRKMLALTQD